MKVIQIIKFEEHLQCCKFYLIASAKQSMWLWFLSQWVRFFLCPILCYCKVSWAALCSRNSKPFLLQFILKVCEMNFCFCFLISLGSENFLKQGKILPSSYQPQILFNCILIFSLCRSSQTMSGFCSISMFSMFYLIDWNFELNTFESNMNYKVLQIIYTFVQIVLYIYV